MKTSAGLVALLMLFASVPCTADLIVSRSIIEMANDEARADLVLINNDENNTLYVQVDPFVVAQPGTETQELVALTAEDNAGLLVSPNKLAIPPGGRSLVRILNLEKDMKLERIYRVNFTPLTPPVEIAEPNGQDIKSRLDVVVAYQVLVMIRPANPAVINTYSREGNKALFGNNGNANYLLTEGQQCDPLNQADCRPLPDHRIYEGNNWSLELPYDAPFSYKIRKPEGLSALEFE